MPVVVEDPPDLDQRVINRLCHVLARDLYHRHQPAVSGPTPQSNALQIALVNYVQHYEPQPKRKP